VGGAQRCVAIHGTGHYAKTYQMRGQGLVELPLMLALLPIDGWDLIAWLYLLTAEAAGSNGCR